MAISDLDVKVRYQGNGATVAFAINQDVDAKTEIQVYLRDESVTPATETLQVETTDFTFDADPPTIVTFNTAPTSSEVVLIIRSNPLTQAQDFQSTGNFDPENAEIGLDKLTRIVQEQAEEMSRCPKLPITTGLADQFLDEPEANKVIGWNAAATKLANLTVSDISGSTGMLNPDSAVISDSGGAAISSPTTAAEINALNTLTASGLVGTDASGNVTMIAGVSSTEAGYLSNVTSDIQSQIDDAAASGGGAFDILPGSPAPTEITTQGYVEYEFDANNDQIINLVFEVPAGFDSSTKEVALDIVYSTPATANNTVVGRTVSLYRPGTSLRGTPTDTASGNNVIASDTTANEMQQQTITLSGSGQINATAMAAGDFLLIEFRRDADNASDTNTEVWRLVKSLLQVKVIDQ